MTTAALNSTPLDLMTHPLLLAAQFPGQSWEAWQTVLRALYAVDLSEKELEAYRQLTGRQTPPARPVREALILAGRRSGKSRIASLVAVHAATCREYQLAPGETGLIHVIAADRRQARVVKRYISGLLHACPSLDQLVARETREAIELRNGLAIEISTASYRTIRGYTTVAAICDEIAFWRDEESADPDVEILNALRASMLTVPSALLLSISSPWAKRGAAWALYRRHWGQDGSAVLVVNADTRTLNPTVPEEEIARAYADDPIRAMTEFGAAFRSDIEQFLPLEVLEACVEPGCTMRSWQRGTRYVAFIDPAGGTGRDSFTAAIAHVDVAADRVVLDGIYERRPPYNPEQVAQEVAAWLKQWDLWSATADRYAGDWPSTAFRRYGITVSPSPLTRSELYAELLPLITSGRVDLLDERRLIAQLSQLERRQARSGRESIDHPPGSHDDVANAAAGALVMAVRSRASTGKQVELYGV